MGYHRAGFDVVGVDIEPQPRYPFEFHRVDALEYLAEHGDGFDAIHASPPCQHYSQMSNCRPGLSSEYPDLLQPTIDALVLTGLPWVVENVEGSGLPRQETFDGDYGLLLCGTMFGLALYRHRLFQSSVPVVEPHHPVHLVPASRAGHWEPGTVISVSGNCSPIAVARDAMGIDWMNRNELAESIPPAYTEYIGRTLIEALGRAA